MDALALLEHVFPSAQVFAICALVMALAQAVYVLLGFGAGLIAVGLLALVVPEIRDVVVVLLLLNLPVELSVVRSTFRAVSWRRVLAVCIGIAFGVPLGTMVLSLARPGLILLVLGALLVVTGAGFLLTPARRAIRWPTWTAPPTGLVAGVLAGAFGTGGPPLIVYYQLGDADKRAFRANLMAIFLIVSLLRIPSYALAGLITAERLLAAAALLPAVLVGAYLGNRVHLTISEGAFRRAVCLALMAIGAVLMVERAP